MGSTDHAQGRDWHGPQPVFILVRPQLGENIGAAARAMWNFGLEHMRIVAPRDGWPNPAAAATASGAARVLDQVRIDPSVETSVADLTHVYATTARPREITKPVLSPEEAMADARARIARGEKVGVMFGPERAGLENADVVLANTIVTVPVNPAFASLNLAQCALLVAYEWGRESLPVARPEPKGRPANRVEVTKLLEALEERLERADFYRPEHKREHMRTTLHNLFYRLDFSEPDIRILHGIFRALADRHPTRD